MTVYRGNPLLMTVMGANPGTRRRKPDDPIDKAISSAWHRLMSGVQVPIMDIPRIFRDIKLEVAAGMPIDQAVLAVGNRYRVNRNPGFGEAIVGGMAGALINRALQSNPGPQFVVVDSETGVVGYKKRATGVGSEAISSCVAAATRLANRSGRSQIVFLDLGRAYIGAQLSIPMIRHMGITTEVYPGGFQSRGHHSRNNPPRRLASRRNPAIERSWDGLKVRPRLAILEFAGIPYEQARRLAARPWGTLPPSIQSDVMKGWQENPGGLRPKRAGIYCVMCGEWLKERGPYHTMKVGPQKGRIICDLCYRGIRSGRRSGEKWAQNVQSNPGPRGKRRMTMTVQRFANWVKSKRDPAMWKAFLSKFKGFEKWTHGARARKVTVEWVETPGVDGLWITYDGGKQPESTYIMPKGSKRKGAWKHEWDTMPDIKHDPAAGIVLTKLRGQSKITDFYHR